MMHVIHKLPAGDKKRVVPANQAKVSDAKKQQVSSYTQCFYCHGTANQSGGSHKKESCPLRVSD